MLPYEKDPLESAKSAGIAGLVGKYMIYVCDNSWQHEFYIKNERTVDYRILGGPVAGRWVKGQEVHMARLGHNVFKCSWNEPTGTVVSLAVDLSERRVHSITVFPQWVAQDPRESVGFQSVGFQSVGFQSVGFQSVGFQNEHLDEMRRYRDAGPKDQKRVLGEFGAITFIEDRVPNNEQDVRQVVM
jgi:phenolic acid decarboxylase